MLLWKPNAASEGRIYRRAHEDMYDDMMIMMMMWAVGTSLMAPRGDAIFLYSYLMAAKSMPSNT